MKPRSLCVLAAIAAALLGCGEEDPFENLRPRVDEGSGRIWEVAAEDLPSAFDIVTGRRLFLGAGDIGQGSGDIFLDGAPSSTELRLRSVISLLRAEAAHLVEIQDLGEVDFEALGEVPEEEGYLAAGDTSGAAVAQGHVYALRIRRSELPPNFAKLLIVGIGSTGEDPDGQFIDFRYAVQTQPGNPRFEEE